MKSLATKPKQFSGGFSIVEFSVATTIALIIMAAVTQVYLSSRTTYGVQEGLSRVQENGRFAIDFIGRDVRMAGYTGCTDDSTKIKEDVSGALVEFGPGKFLRGHAYSGTGTATLADWTPALPASLFAANDVLPYNDVIVIRRASEDTVQVGTPGMPDPSAALPVGVNNGFVQGDIVIVSDCRNADIFQIANANPDTAGNLVHNTGGSVLPGNTTGNLSKTYGTDAEVFRFITRAYYVGAGTSTDRNGAAVPALFRKELAASGGNATVQRQELVEGVERMKILFGQDTNNDRDADVYRWANQVGSADTAWATVTAAQIGLLARTPDSVETTTDTTVYHLLRIADVSATDATTIADNFGPANDLVRRRVFSATVHVRNSIRD